MIFKSHYEYLPNKVYCIAYARDMTFIFRTIFTIDNETWTTNPQFKILLFDIIKQFEFNKIHCHNIIIDQISIEKSFRLKISSIEN